MGPALKEEYINPNAKFNDFMLKSRLGRSRLTYAFNMKCEKMYQFFSDYRQKQERHIIQIPYQLKEANFDLKVWQSVTQIDV